MNIGDYVRYQSPDDIDPAYADREFVAMVTEVDPLDPNAVGLFIFWPTYTFLPYRPLDNPVTLDDTAPYGPDTWHPIT